MRHPHHVHRMAMNYPVSASDRMYVLVLVPVIIFCLVVIALSVFPATAVPGSVSFLTIAEAALFTMVRLAIAYALAVFIAIPLSLLVTANKTAEELLLPVFDIFESVPILALFPVIIFLFVQFNFINGAAIFILFLSMLWNLVFTIVGGLKIIPRDIMYAAQVFGFRGWRKLRYVTLPAVFPQFVTGSILAVAQGWNLIIVAEVLHTYIPHGTSSQDLFGIGSLLVSAAANVQHDIFLWTVLIMIACIAALNLLVWQRLLHRAQRYRFD
jgi:NitT/TauT family transport system permease protein